MEVTSERFEYNSILDTVKVTFIASDMGQNTLYTAEQEEGCNPIQDYFFPQLTGDGTYVSEFEVLKEETGYVPWYVASSKDSPRLKSGCIFEEPEPVVEPEILTWEIVDTPDNQYTMQATFANLEPGVVAYLRRQNGVTECVAPDVIAENSQANFAPMADSILNNGSFTTNFGTADFVSVMLIIADAQGNIFDYKTVCRDFP